MDDSITWIGWLYDMGGLWINEGNKGIRVSGTNFIRPGTILLRIVV